MLYHDFKYIDDSITSNISTDWECQIKERKSRWLKTDPGVLQYLCTTNTSKPDDSETYKCHNSDEMYEYNGLSVTNLCSNDPRFYQVCAFMERTPFTNKEVLCGNYYICETGSDNRLLKVNESIWHLKFRCNGKNDCKNTDLDEVGCSERTTLPSGEKVPSDEVCNNKCEMKNCEDEAECNGYRYGLYCNLDPSIYVGQHEVCDGDMKCPRLSFDHVAQDEENCAVTNETQASCKSSREKKVPLFNYTRCGSTRTYPQTDGVICLNRHEQTNCTDPDKVGLSCEVNGYMTTVSKLMICYPGRIQICDDNIENNCIKVSSTCEVHKHFMCDGKLDCESNLDETNPICKHKTEQKCKRRVGNSEELPIPLAWIEDGVEDCVDGRDEMKRWPTCGTGNTQRFVASNDFCENVYVCPWDKPWHVELEDLCDGIETCGNENKVCSESLGFAQISTTVHTTDKGLKKHLSYCIKGIKESRHFIKNCTTLHSVTVQNQEVFGINFTAITLPSELQNCDHMFGEMYVYTSCTNKCINSSCPLSNVPRYEMCMDQFPDRIGTIVDNKYLTFVTRSFGDIYTNRYFVCNNKIKCIDYSKVCDLVDDCGDGSDEEICTNHFKCNSTGRYIPKTKVCDKIFDCLDLSDECNNQCSGFILKDSALKGLSWIIGSLATVTNIIIISKNALTLKRCRTTVALLNKSLIMMISFGDLFVGAYLFIISIYDGIIFKESYCDNQTSWISSSSCSIIGVISTLGSQISLFAMCVLSLTRIIGIYNSMRIPGEVNWRKAILVAVGVIILILSSLSIAAIPIMGEFEDFFVNGMNYAEELKVFIGTPDKRKTLTILEAYYGRMRRTALSWKMINRMVRKMYSHDFEYPDHTTKISKVDFYGNDGVCLFKYFVKDQDPQRLFVWSILTVNFVCFILITLSYIVIGFISYKSSKGLTKSGGNQQVLQRNRKMNRKISIIITTDFLCWVPFIVICVLHSIEVLDATPWYSLFSIIILPINSVINPLIYDDTITSLIISHLQKVWVFISTTRMYQNVSLRLRLSQPPATDNIELSSL